MLAALASCSSDGGDSLPVSPNDAGEDMAVDGGPAHADAATEAPATPTESGAPGTPEAGGMDANRAPDAAPDGAGDASAADSGDHEAGPAMPDPCIEAGSCPLGTWIRVTPSNVDLSSMLDCGNFGTQSVGVDPQRSSDFYAEFNCQGIWKSTDYGTTWKGPINTGTNGAAAGDCAGGISVASGGPGNPPVLYESCIRGTVVGFLASTDGGVSWTSYPIQALPSNRQDVYPPSVDPYDPQHLLMTGHEQNYIVQSKDGGHTWTNVAMSSGMMENGGTGFAFFVDRGNASDTAGTWLWIAQQSGGTYGTWRTADGGGSWTRVDANEHPHGASQIYAAGGGVVYMGGVYSAEGWGVLRSSDYGQTWAHVGATTNETVVWGTPKQVYAAYGWADGIGTTDPTNFQVASAQGTSGWTSPTTPAAMIEGPGHVATSFDGAHYVFVGAMWQAGLWMYVEP
jgi:hypothetical protein